MYYRVNTKALAETRFGYATVAGLEMRWTSAFLATVAGALSYVVINVVKPWPWWWLLRKQKKERPNE